MTLTHKLGKCDGYFGSDAITGQEKDLLVSQCHHHKVFVCFKQNLEGDILAANEEIVYRLDVKDREVLLETGNDRHVIRV